MTEQLLTETRFSDLQLPPPLQQGLDEAGFRFCTLIQDKTLPIALSGHDVAGQAQTGTGKTVAFLVSLYTHLLTHPARRERKLTQPRAIVIAPTRELAIQIHKDADALGRHLPFRMGLIYGGTEYIKQRETLERGVDIIIGTPGRIIDYFKQRVFDLRAIQVAVLDEADRMFDLGFIKDIRFMMRRMPAPEMRLSMLFSATLSYRVMELAYEHMNNPHLVKIETTGITAERVREVVYFPANSEKIPLLLGLLKRHAPERAMIFVNTKQVGEVLAAYLGANDHNVALLSGDVPQRKRQALIQGFEAGKYPLLVATDVASRGLHIPDVSHIFNYDLPQTEEDYVHRVGRTARVGADGDAISFACEDSAFHLPEIERFVGHKIPVESVTPELLIQPQQPARRERRRPPNKSSNQKRGGRRRRKPATVD